MAAEHGLGTHKVDDGFAPGWPAGMRAELRIPGARR